MIRLNHIGSISPVTSQRVNGESQRSETNKNKPTVFHSVSHLLLNRKVVLIFWFCFLCCFSGTVEAGKTESPFQMLTRLNQYNGLSSSKVNDILKDRSGFIWIATTNGINRYDSKAVISYLPDQQSSNSLSNWINCLFQTQKGTLYAGTQTGLYRYDLEQDRYLREGFHPAGQNDTISVYSITEDAKGQIYLGTNRGIWKKQHDQFFTFLSEAKPFEEAAPILNFDQNGLLWIGLNGQGIFYWDFNRNKLTPFTIVDSNLDKELFMGIQDIINGPDGSIWIASWGFGLIQILPDKKNFRIYRHAPNNSNSPNSDQVKSIAFDPTGRLWIGYEEAGLDYFMPEQNRFVHFFDPISMNARFEEPSIYKVFIDQDLIMWLGFRNDGLQAYALYENTFKRYTNPIDLATYQVFCLKETPRRELAAGVRGAIDLVNPDNNHFQRFYLPGKETPVSITPYKREELLVATYNNNVYRFNLTTGKFAPELIQDPQDPLYLKQIRLIRHLPEENAYLLGSSIGLHKISLGGNQQPELVLDQWIHSVHQDDSPFTFWAASYGYPFYRVNLKTNESQPFNFNTTKDIKAFVKHQEYLFVGTDLGFYKINLSTKETVEFENIFPYPNLQINGMEKDDYSGIWCSSSESIIHYDLLNDEFRTYDKSDRLPDIRFRDGVSCRLSNGSIAFGGQGGILIFDPQKLKKQKNHAKLMFTGLRIHNQPVLPGEKRSPLASNISLTDHLTLRNHQSNISLDFSLLSYVNPSKHRFRYKIDGHNREWVDLGNQHQITFNNLNTGIYRLTLQAANHDNQWSQEKKITLEILPPFYQTWYAFLIYLTFALVLILIFLKAYKGRQKVKHEMHTNELKLRNLQKLAQQENKFHEMKVRFFTNISHELRTPISLIMAPLDKFLSSGQQPDQENLELMHRNAERLNRLVTQILDFRKMEAGKLKLELSKGDFSDFCRRKAMLFLPMAQKKNLKYFINIPAEPGNIWFDADKMEKILYNLLSNAFKFTSEGSVSISLTYVTEPHNQTEFPTNYMEIRVSDTGKGITEEESKHIFTRFYSAATHHGPIEGTGIGLSLTREMVRIHQGEIFFEARTEKGTDFVVRIPSTLHQDEAPKKEDLTLHNSQPCPEKQDASLRIETEENARILFVDDNEDMRNFVKQEFEPEFTVLLAANGLEGIRVAEDELPDLIISDVLMPQMDGIQMCELLRNNPNTSHIPIIILSAQESPAVKIRSFKTGIDDYITKPFSPDMLHLRVRNLLQSRKELQNRFSRELKLETNSLAITNSDEAFLNKVMAIIEENLTNEEFSADFFADKMGMSRVHLYRKLKTLTGESVSEFVKTIRLKFAADLIRNKQMSVKEVTYQVGFSDPKYFSKCFKQQFGLKPTEYAQTHE